METIDVFTDPCMLCGHTGIVKNVPKAGYALWEAGEFIQVALPMLSADDREQLMTGTHPACWDAMMPAEDDE